MNRHHLTAPALLTIAALAVFVLGCSDDSVKPGPVVDGGFSLIEALGVAGVEPATFTVGDTIVIEFAVTSRYPGKAILYVEGENAFGNFGRLLSPADTVLGYYWRMTDVEAGLNLIPWTVRVGNAHDHFRMSIVADLDSLLVDGRYVHWESAEGHAVYRPDIPPDTAFLFNGIGYSFYVDHLDEQAY